MLTWDLVILNPHCLDSWIMVVTYEALSQVTLIPLTLHLVDWIGYVYHMHINGYDILKYHIQLNML